MKTWCTIQLDRTRENILQTCIECLITKDNVFQLNAFQNEKIFGESSSRAVSFSYWERLHRVHLLPCNPKALSTYLESNRL